VFAGCGKGLPPQDAAIAALQMEAGHGWLFPRTV
jgi:hypothetical protein